MITEEMQEAARAAGKSLYAHIAALTATALEIRDERDALAKRVEELEAETIERCAKIADRAAWAEGDANPLEASVCEGIAEEIRALLTKATP